MSAACRIRGHLKAKQKETDQGEIEGKELRRLADEFQKERLMLDDMRRREAFMFADINRTQLANNEVARRANAQQEEVRTRQGLAVQGVCIQYMYKPNSEVPSSRIRMKEILLLEMIKKEVVYVGGNPSRNTGVKIKHLKKKDKQDI